RDHQNVLQLVEVDRGLQVRGLDDRVRVPPDVDYLADQQPLRIGRANAAAQLDAGRHDLVADLRPLCGVDVLHHEHAAELADDLAPCRRCLDLAHDRRLGVVHQPHGCEVRADVDDPPGERTAGCDHDVTQL